MQPVDRHIGVRYKTAVYRAVRAESMRLIRKNKEATSIKMKPLEKRVLITKIVAETHERLARDGVFKRAFLATGTQLPNDRSADSEVDLQGVNMKYEEVITSEMVEKHMRTIEEREAKEKADQVAAIKLAQEKALAIAKHFSPAVELSKSIQPGLKPSVIAAALPNFNIIASHVNKDYICARSYPAAVLASV